VEHLKGRSLNQDVNVPAYEAINALHLVQGKDLELGSQKDRIEKLELDF
jgi:hypothetical protein